MGTKIKYRILTALIFTAVLISYQPSPALAQTRCGTQTCDDLTQTCVQIPSTGNTQCVNKAGNLPNTAADNYIRGTVTGGTTGTSAQLGRGITDIFVDSIGELPGKTVGGNTTTASLIQALYQNKPASTSEFVADLRNNIGLPGPKPAYAQGFGFAAVSPILNLWRLARNVALAGLVVVFIVVGIMIMLRSKIDPRTVITIQQALPRLVITLILVLLSYAIVGFLIDITTVITRLGAPLLQNAKLIAFDGNNANPTANTGLLDSLLSGQFFTNFFPLLNFDKQVSNIALPGGFFGPVNLILGAAAKGGLLGAVLSIAVFIAMIRTFFSLLEAYLKITLGIILAPIQFLFYAVPGQGKGFGDWFRGMLSNLLVFPAVFFMLAFAAIFAAQVGNQVWYTTNNPWKVGVQTFGPSTSYWAPVGLGDWGGAVGPLLSLAIILTIPKAASTVRELVHPSYRPGAAEGEVAKGVQAAAGRIPVLGSFTKM